ncbi:uncharacterized protein JCM10292_007713 [Rhodotorula paludigena]|uniref:uncharacterized protein n=1 Tax=Rhodotorula paludigena TaxID=86838 RepID=UPI00317C0074
MASLSTRAAQAAAIARTKRLCWLSSGVGLVSLVGLTVSTLPWNILATQGQYVAFALAAAAAFVWLVVPIVLAGYLAMPKQVATAWWTLSVAAVLPLLSTLLLILLQRSFKHLPQHATYGALHTGTDDLPPGWDVPPEHLAPDSSASDSDSDGGYSPSASRRHAYKSAGSSRARTPDPEAAAQGWYELGRRSDELGGRKEGEEGKGRGRWEEGGVAIEAAPASASR